VNSYVFFIQLIPSGIEVSFHLRKRFGYDVDFVDKVAYIMDLIETNR